MPGENDGNSIEQVGFAVRSGGAWKYLLRSLGIIQ